MVIDNTQFGQKDATTEKSNLQLDFILQWNFNPDYTYLYAMLGTICLSVIQLSVITYLCCKYSKNKR